MLFWLLETENQVKTYLNRGYEEAFVEIIPYNNYIHPCENNVSLLYVRPLNSNKGFMFSLYHTEALSLDNEIINLVLDSLKKIYVRDKKEFLHYFPIKNLYDITLDNHYDIKYTTIYNVFYNRIKNNKNTNLLIPITKHYELCNNIYNDLKQNIDKNINKFYNTKASIVFNSIEREGIRINNKEFSKYFYPTKSEIIYTQYNFKTTTTRPSNHFNKINFAALNKENGCRKSFIPKNDKFIELDITAYHPTILANLINYKFESSDIHGEFAKIYNTTYDKAKIKTFQIIYGGLFENYEHIKYFNLAKKYTNNLWEEFNTNGYVKCEITEHKFEKDKLMDMNPSKLLNYVIQQKETAYNIQILWDILKIIKNKNTKILLYVYDSILLDFDENEQDVLDSIKNVFNIRNLQLKEKIGYNYNSLELK